MIVRRQPPGSSSTEEICENGRLVHKLRSNIKPVNHKKIPHSKFLSTEKLNADIKKTVHINLWENNLFEFYNPSVLEIFFNYTFHCVLLNVCS